MFVIAKFQRWLDEEFRKKLAAVTVIDSLEHVSLISYEKFMVNYIM